MQTLADSSALSAENFNTALTSGGIICAFLFVAVVLLIALYKFVIGPEMKESRTARAAEQQQTAAISANFATSTQNIKDCLATANEMHARCHAAQEAANHG